MNKDTLKFDLENGVNFEVVDKFCYLGDMISADGGVEAAVETRVVTAWKKFKELSPFLLAKRISLRLKGKVYASCVRSSMTYASETWALTAKLENRLETTDMRMVRWICGVSLRDQKTSDELRTLLGLQPINVLCRHNRLRWFGHVERREDDDWLRKCTTLKVDGRRRAGRPRKTWSEVLGKDMKERGILAEWAQDRDLWRKMIHIGKSADLDISGKSADPEM